MFKTTTVVGEKRELVVYPAPFPLEDFVISSAEETGDAPDYRSTSLFTPNVVSVRRYSVGDSLNRIHWKSSAKLNRLMVKEFETEVQSDLAILLDLNQSVQVGDGLSGTEEIGVTVAASIARYLLEFDNGVGFSAIGDTEYTIPGGTGDKHLWRILEALALCRAEGRMPLADLLAAHEARFQSADRHDRDYAIGGGRDDGGGILARAELAGGSDPAGADEFWGQDGLFGRTGEPVFDGSCGIHRAAGRRHRKGAEFQCFGA